MIPKTNTGMTETGSLGGEEIEMTVSLKNMAHLINMYTDTYEDPEQAVVREYATNALDSHIKAGTTRPIEIETPSRLSPFFKVKDWGVGMNIDDIRNIYSIYGESDKQHSDDFVGMFGLGCKAALAYTNSFNVTAVKDGLRTLVAVRRRANGTGVMEVVDTSGTDLPNGVEITVPVKDANEFHEKALQFFRFWKPGTVLVNGSQPKPYEGVKVAEGIYYNGERNQSFIVMGNVPYPIKNFDRFLGNYRYNDWSMVAYVNVGDVSIPQSRETMIYDDSTKAVIREKAVEFEKGLIQAAKDEILAKPSIGEAWDRWRYWASKFGSHTLGEVKYNGHQFVSNVTHDCIRYSPNASRHSVWSCQNADISNIRDAGWVITGYPVNKNTVSSYNKRKIKEYRNSNGLGGYVWLVDTMPATPFLEGVKQVPWSEIAKIRLNNGPGNTWRPAGGWQIRTKDNKSLHTVDKLPSGTLLYYSSADKDFLKPQHVLNYLQADATLVCLSKNRWDKFQREHGRAHELREFVAAEVKRRAEAIGDEQILYANMGYWAKSFYESLDETKILDPDFVYMIKLAKNGPSSKTDSLKNVRTLAQVVMVSVPDSKAKAASLESRYPLLDFSGAPHFKSHIYTYVNAVWKETK